MGYPSIGADIRNLDSNILIILVYEFVYNALPKITFYFVLVPTIYLDKIFI